ncbi:PREDICTED: uncharacterized protein LOC104819816 [Tarenaya hassleriana]|uniref:uncharacterized protein LOC104819816 n=1 Tax=Tarenaya hassleriana TaxID=28532 RepID=UPI00053C18D4|nr:PREDICTED: uncharacterized protein LOC104819816 [Tarenaya hassleriana]
MAKPRNIFAVCSMLMSLLFAYSASVQLNDPDWYFWFPVYAMACAVNLMNCGISSGTRGIGQMKKTALGFGLFLFVKVVLEDLTTNAAGFLSLDLTRRVVREKIGSGLVVASMALHLQASSQERKLRGEKHDSANWLHLGMGATVVFGYGLPVWFFTVQKGEMKL